MFRSTLKRGIAVTSAVTALGILAGATLAPTASADPRQHTNQVVGTGSDTTQEILNAFTGQADDDYYTPLASSPAFGRTQISSWDAVPPGDPNNNLTCIAPRSGLNAFQRPNGSSQGRYALSRSFSGAALTFTNPTGDSACAGKSTSGIVDFARSSSGPSGSTNSGLTYIPFGKDALTYAFTYVDGVTGDTGDTIALGHEDLSFAELQSVFTGAASPGGTTVRSLLVVPCDIQHGSGTQKDWDGKVGGAVTEASIDTASNRCDALGVVGADPNGRLQESKPNQLEAKADLFETANPGVPAMLIVGHSVSNFVAQSNGASPSNLSPGVTLGSAIAGQQPFTGTAPTLVPNGAFYDATPAAPGVTPGRKVYNVVLTDVRDNPGNDGLKELFFGATSKVCQATATIQKFGFALLTGSGADACGDTSATGDFIASA